MHAANSLIIITFYFFCFILFAVGAYRPLHFQMVRFAQFVLNIAVAYMDTDRGTQK